MRKSPNRDLRYIQHPLNPSKSKSSYSFSRSERFRQQKSFSPNKFYQLPSTKSHRASTMGIGSRSNFEKSDFVEPGKYNIPTEFEKNCSKTPRFTTFGIGREEFYKGRTDANPVGPGAYQVQSKRKKSSIYIGTRFEPPLERHTVSAATYDIKETSLNKLSTYKNESVFRMKTEYYPKSKLQEYDNHIPGPGSYRYQESNNRIITKNKTNLFGKEERIKKEKPSKVGPGSYHIFSQFGYS